MKKSPYFILRNKEKCKPLLIMKLTILFTVLTFFQVTATVMSQDLSFHLNVKNKPVKEVLNLLEEESNYRFFFNDDFHDLNRNVTIKVKDKKVEEILSIMFENSDITYREIEDNLFIIAPISRFQNKITGTVIDGETNMPLPGVNVFVKGTTIGTVTDVNGIYSIIVDDSVSILVFSYIGYTTQEINIQNKTKIDILLMPDFEELGEVVVVGYGSMKKSDLTGSIAQISSEEIASKPVINAAEALQGSVAGIDMTGSAEPGSSPDILIRGQSSITGSNDPLWVIDGIPIQGGNIDINPSDIEKIDILKDASATSIYGSRGSNGVIIVTTKRASKESPISFTYDTYSGVQKTAKMLDLMNGQKYAEYAREAFRAVIPVELTEEQIDDEIFDDVQMQSITDGTYSDWQKLVLDNNGFITNHNLAMSAHSKNLSSSASVGYTKNQSVIDIANYERYNFKLNTDFQISPRFKISSSMMYSFGIQNELPKYVRHYVDLNPLGVPYDENGFMLLYTNPFEGQITNPLIELSNNKLEERTTRFLGNLTASYDFTDHLNYKLILGPDVRFHRGGEFNDVETRSRQEEGSGTRYAQYDMIKTINYTFDHIVNYNKTFNKIHKIDITGAVDVYLNRAEGSEISGVGMDYNGDWYNLNASKTDIGSSFLSESSLLSYMGRINYVLAEKYMFTFTGRYDGSSRLANEHKWDFFPSAALAWRISEEEFINDEIINNLKLRISYGKTGNQSVAIYGTQGLLGLTYYDWDNTPALGYVPTVVPNPNLRWETTSEYNIGINWGIFNSLIYGEIDIYDRLTEDLLFNRELPATSGTERITENIGAVRNKGIEFSISGYPVRKKDLNVKIDVNFSANKNEIVDLYGNKEDDIGNELFIGQPINVNYVFIYEGVWQLDEIEAAGAIDAEPGYPKLRGTGENGEPTSDDRVIMVNDPKWIGGLNLTIEYKNFDFGAYAYTRQGMQAFSEVHSSLLQLNGRYNSAINNYWTEDNPTNENPRPSRNGYGENFKNSSYFIKDLSFVRLSNITLGYTFNQELLSRIGIHKLRAYFTAKNLVTWTDYDGWDPEQGTKRNSHPLMRSYFIGLNLSF